MEKKKRKQYRAYDGNEFMHNAFGPTPSEITVEEWKQFAALTGWRKEKQALILEFDGKESGKELAVTAPGLGGIRVHTEQAGFFQPEMVETLAYEESKDTLTFTASDGTGVHITRGDDWKLRIYDSTGAEQFVLNKESLLVGYKEGKAERVKLTFEIGEEELLCGLGERFSGVNQNGNRHFFWNMDCGYHGDSRGAELWRSYKNIPLLHSDKGYTLFFDSFYPAVSDMGYTEEKLCIWDFWGPTLDLFFWTGDIRRRLASYIELTGKPFLPPKWAFRYMSGGGNGFWYGEDWGNGNIPEQYLAVLKDVIDGYRRLGTPHVAALYGEGWIADNPKAYEMLREDGVRMLRWNPPDYPVEVMRECLPGLADQELPNVKDVKEPEKTAGNYIDFFNPHAKAVIQRRLEAYFPLGLRGGMLDFAEMVPDDVLYCNGMTGREMHNFNPYWYTKVYGEATREILGDDYLYYCRGGCAGSQRYAGVFSGDQAATFEGLRQQLMSALSLSLCGFSAWGGDLAGYEGKPEEETFVRGIEFAAFQPLMRAHGTRTRCPWDFGKQAEKAHVIYYWLRENLVELLYSSAVLANKTGMPMMQPMVLAFPEEKGLAANETQYLFCDTVLVAPVIEEGARTKLVHFPEGIWYELWTGQQQPGGVSVDVLAPLMECPVYLKQGTVFAVNISEDLQWAEAFEEDTMVKALVITPSAGTDRTEYAMDTEHSVLFENCYRNRTVRVNADQKMNIGNFLVYGAVEKVQMDGKEVSFELLADRGADEISRIRIAVSEAGWNEMAFVLKQERGV